MKNRSRWSPNKIAEAVFVISKHANDYQEMIVQQGGVIGHGILAGKLSR